MKKIKWVLIGIVCIGFFFLLMYVKAGIYNQHPAEDKGAEAETARSDGPTDRIILHYHERKPYYYTTDDGVKGVLAEKAASAFNRSGVPFRWEKTPPNRQLEIIRENQDMTCALGWFKNPERERYAKYTEFVYQDKPTLALARADNERMPNNLSLDRLFIDRGLRILRKDGYSYGKFIDEKIVQYKPREVLTTADNLSMLKMIHSLRADYFFIAHEEADQLITESAFELSDFKYIHFSNMPEGNKRYIICAQNVPDLIMTKLNHAIRDSRPAAKNMSRK